MALLYGNQFRSFMAYTIWIKICCLILKTKFINRAMLFDETLIKLFDTDISFNRIFCLIVLNVL